MKLIKDGLCKQKMAKKLKGLNVSVSEKTDTTSHLFKI